MNQLRTLLERVDIVLFKPQFKMCLNKQAIRGHIEVSNIALIMRLYVMWVMVLFFSYVIAIEDVGVEMS